MILLPSAVHGPDISGERSVEKKPELIVYRGFFSRDFYFLGCCYPWDDYTKPWQTDTTFNRYKYLNWESGIYRQHMATVPSDSNCKYIIHPSFLQVLNAILKYFGFHSHMMLELKDSESFIETLKHLGDAVLHVQWSL